MARKASEDSANSAASKLEQAMEIFGKGIRTD